MSRVPEQIVEALCVGPLLEVRKRILEVTDPYERALQCLIEFRRMLDDGYTLANPADPDMGKQLTRVIKLIAMTDAVLIPLRGK